MFNLLFIRVNIQNEESQCNIKMSFFSIYFLKYICKKCFSNPIIHFASLNGDVVKF